MLPRTETIALLLLVMIGVSYSHLDAAIAYPGEYLEHERAINNEHQETIKHTDEELHQHGFRPAHLFPNRKFNEYPSHSITLKYLRKNIDKTNSNSRSNRQKNSRKGLEIDYQGTKPHGSIKNGYYIDKKNDFSDLKHFRQGTKLDLFNKNKHGVIKATNRKENIPHKSHFRANSYRRAKKVYDDNDYLKDEIRQMSVDFQKSLLKSKLKMQNDKYNHLFEKHRFSNVNRINHNKPSNRDEIFYTKSLHGKDTLNSHKNKKSKPGKLRTHTLGRKLLQWEGKQKNSVSEEEEEESRTKEKGNLVLNVAPVHHTSTENTYDVLLTEDSEEIISDFNNNGTSNLSTSAECNTTFTTNHMNLTQLEEELIKKHNSQRDLLLAISILQHHSHPSSVSTTSPSSSEIDHDLRNELMHSNEESYENFDLLESPIVRNDEPLFSLNEEIKEEDNSRVGTYKPTLPNTMFMKDKSSFKLKKEPMRVNIKSKSDEVLPNLDETKPLYPVSDIGFLPNNMIFGNILRRAKYNDKYSKHQKKLNFTNSTTRVHHGKGIKQFRENNMDWIILVMDGDCGIISKRMNTFVTFLKAALSSKLETTYDDIYVMSVFCDNTFMVNISLSSNLYSKALSELQALADANTTLLEISGEIFYLEKIITQYNRGLLGRLQGAEQPQDVEVVIYIAVGCVCTFILVSVFLVTLISICRKDQQDYCEEKCHTIDKSDFPIRKPNVIYSHKFTQELNPEKYRLTPFEDRSGGGVAPTDSISFDSSSRYPSQCVDVQTRDRYQDRKNFTNPSSSKIQLLEEVQEEDEDEIEDGAVLEGDEDYHEEDDDGDDVLDDDDDDFIIENMSRPLTSHRQTLAPNQSAPAASSATGVRLAHHAHNCCRASDLPTSFDNPCYNR